MSDASAPPPNRTRPRLGRGLSSLMSVADPSGAPPVSADAGGGRAALRADDGGALQNRVLELSVGSIDPNPHQPRRQFDEASLADLAASLKSSGLIQPIVVRPVGERYELIAGERRLRAAKLAGLQTIPAIVKEVDAYTQAQLALIENIQREDLNPIDRALAYNALVQQLGLTHAELAARLGENRTVVSHFLRLLDLSDSVRDMVQANQVSVGHGKLLAGLADASEQLRLARLVVDQGLSVRNLERILEQQQGAPEEAGEGKQPSSAHIQDLERSISRQLGMRVQVKWSASRGKGKLVIFYNLDQFDHLKERLGIVTD